jgi:hypothetical protein
MSDYEDYEYEPSNREKVQSTGTTKWMWYDYDTDSAYKKINSVKKFKSELKRLGIGNYKYSV